VVSTESKPFFFSLEGVSFLSMRMLEVFVYFFVFALLPTTGPHEFMPLLVIKQQFHFCLHPLPWSFPLSPQKPTQFSSDNSKCRTIWLCFRWDFCFFAKFFNGGIQFPFPLYACDFFFPTSQLLDHPDG